MTSGLRIRSATGELSPRGSQSDHQAGGGTGQVVSHVRELIERGALKPGDRLPAERDLATQIGVSRPTIRAGLRTLAAMGVVRSRHGSGTYIPEGPPALNTDALSFLAALHGFTREEMYEARRILEVGAAGLAAERATAEQVATLAEEVASLFASMQEPRVFLVHDINFHRGVAAASGNPIVASLVEMVSALYYERRRETAAGGERARPARRRRDAPPDLPGHPRARRRHGAGARCTIICSRPAGTRRRSRRPTRTLPRGALFDRLRVSLRARRRFPSVARASGAGRRRSDHTHETV